MVNSTTGEPLGKAALTLRRAESQRIAFDVYNAGDTVWLCSAETPGWTRIGLHLYRADAQRTLVDYDWVRAPVPHDVAPERSVTIEIDIPPIDNPGDYAIVVDLVIEGTAWFADRGSVPFQLGWRVT